MAPKKPAKKKKTPASNKRQANSKAQPKGKKSKEPLTQELLVVNELETGNIRKQPMRATKKQREKVVTKSPEASEVKPEPSPSSSSSPTSLRSSLKDGSNFSPRPRRTVTFNEEVRFSGDRLNLPQTPVHGVVFAASGRRRSFSESPSRDDDDGDLPILPDYESNADETLMSGGLHANHGPARTGESDQSSLPDYESPSPSNHSSRSRQPQGRLETLGTLEDDPDLSLPDRPLSEEIDAYYTRMARFEADRETVVKCPETIPEMREAIRNLTKELRRFATTFFSFELSEPLVQKQQRFSLSEFAVGAPDLMRFVANVADGSKYGWHHLFMDGEQRAHLAFALVAKVMETHILDHTFFGAGAARLDRLHEMDRIHVKDDAFDRVTLRTEILREDILPHYGDSDLGLSNRTLENTSHISRSTHKHLLLPLLTLMLPLGPEGQETSKFATASKHSSMWLDHIFSHAVEINHAIRLANVDRTGRKPIIYVWRSIPKFADFNADEQSCKNKDEVDAKEGDGDRLIVNMSLFPALYAYQSVQTRGPESKTPEAKQNSKTKLQAPKQPTDTSQRRSESPSRQLLTEHLSSFQDEMPATSNSTSSNKENKAPSSTSTLTPKARYSAPKENTRSTQSSVRRSTDSEKENRTPPSRPNLDLSGSRNDAVPDFPVPQQHTSKPSDSNRKSQTPHSEISSTFNSDYHTISPNSPRPEAHDAEPAGDSEDEELRQIIRESVEQEEEEYEGENDDDDDDVDMYDLDEDDLEQYIDELEEEASVRSRRSGSPSPELPVQEGGPSTPAQNHGGDGSSRRSTRLGLRGGYAGGDISNPESASITSTRRLSHFSDSITGIPRTPTMDSPARAVTLDATLPIGGIVGGGGGGRLNLSSTTSPSPPTPRRPISPEIPTNLVPALLETTVSRAQVLLIWSPPPAAPTITPGPSNRNLGLVPPEPLTARLRSNLDRTSHRIKRVLSTIRHNPSKIVKPMTRFRREREEPWKRFPHLIRDPDSKFHTHGSLVTTINHDLERRRRFARLQAKRAPAPSHANRRRRRLFYLSTTAILALAATFGTTGPSSVASMIKQKAAPALETLREKFAATVRDGGVVVGVVGLSERGREVVRRLAYGTGGMDVGVAGEAV